MRFWCQCFSFAAKHNAKFVSKVLHGIGVSILSGPYLMHILEELVVGVVVTWSKNVPISKNKVHQSPKGANCYLLWHIMILNCHVSLVWPCVALYGHVVAVHGHRHVWPSVVVYGLVWPFYDLVWSLMAEYRFFSRSTVWFWTTYTLVLKIKTISKMYFWEILWLNLINGPI